MEQKSRAFTFTLNNYVEEDFELLEDVFLNENVDYLCYGKEVGESGTPHLQGYIKFKNPRSFKSVVKKHHRWHLEKAIKPPLANKRYCEKQGDFTEFGNSPKGKGKRSDIDIVKEMVKEGKPMSEICDEVTSYQGLKFAETLKKYKEIKRTWKPNVYWFWGASGTGKTRRAYEMFPDAWESGRDGKWWEGYDGHENIILDDFRADFCKFHELLRILDRYPYRIETKGSSRQLLARNIVITSPYRPSEIYRNKTQEDIYQLIRRIDIVEHFGGSIFGTDGTERRSSVILEKRRPATPEYGIDDEDKSFLDCINEGLRKF